MRRPTTTAARLVAAAVTLASLAGCGSDDEYQLIATDVQRAVETEVRAGVVEVVLPAGAASGGRLVVQEGPAPDAVPEGVVAMGPSAMVSLFEGSLDGSMEVSFDPPLELAPDQVPVVMAKAADGEWEWRPTTWDAGLGPVTAELDRPGQVFLARFDRTPWLAELTEDFAAKANDSAKAGQPTCGDEASLLDAGLQLSSEPGEVLLSCAGVDTIESNAAVAGADVDWATEGVQAPVLRLRNSSRMFTEVGYPTAWPPVDGSGKGALAGQALRERLGLAGSTRAELSTRVLAPGDTLTLLLPADAAGTVTADHSAAAWTLSAMDFATSTYTRLVSGVDGALGRQVRAARTELMAALSSPAAEESTSAAVRECLAPVAEVVLMNRDAAQQLVDQVFTCAPSLLRPSLTEAVSGGSSVMADGVATSVLDGLPTTLEGQEEPWAQISDTMTDASAGFQVWVGDPPAQEHDYSDAPLVFRPGDEVDVEEWSTEFGAYVEERLAALLVETDDPACPDGGISISRYRTDGFALASEVGCDGEPWRLVLGRLDAGWQVIDEIQQDDYFGCSVLGTYSVPTFIAGDTCLDGEQTQEYTG